MIAVVEKTRLIEGTQDAARACYQRFGPAIGGRQVLFGAEPYLPHFAEFYRVNFGPLCIQLFAHTGDMAEAQDVVQEAFCRALTRWQKVSRFDDPAAWVRKVAWNLATSRWRRLRRMVTLTGQHDLVPAPEPDRVDLESALAQLPVQHRQVLVLHYVVGASVAEMAEITGVAEGTVKSRLHRGRAALARLMAREEVHDG